MSAKRPLKKKPEALPAVLAALLAGETAHQAAAATGVDRRTVRRWRDRHVAPVWAAIAAEWAAAPAPAAAPPPKPARSWPHLTHDGGTVAVDACE